MLLSLSVSTGGCGAGNGAADGSRPGSGGASTAPDSGAPGSGGASASGGATGSGGASASGGAGQTGGSTGTGGGASGGQTGSGGSNPGGSGGGPRTGGAGGTTTGGSGGVAASGGAIGGGGRSGGTGGAAMGGGSGEGAQSTIVPDPSWTCGMPDGIPAPTKGTLVFHATLQVGMNRDAGITNFGHRRVIDIKGGSTTGTKLQATVLTGGYEFELTLSNGAVELEQIDILKTSDGSLIYMRSCGVAPPGASEIRIVPDFEVATSKTALTWLNTGKFVGTRVIDSTGAVQLDVYDVANVAASEPKIKLTDPTDKPNQPWECNKMTGGKGTSVFTESVSLGGSLSVGASKRGTRNIIPITGGTVTGKFAGTVLPGGADYQLIGGTTTLDARYVLQSSDGVLLVVRNCGPFGALLPTFETKADGPYAFLNTSAYVSSDPGGAGGGVSITFYERK